MKQKILEWLNNLEGQSKKLQKKIQESKKKYSDPQSNLKRRIAKIDDGILCATIDTDNKDVVITIKGFSSWAKAYDWATLQSILWKTDQDAREELIKNKPKPLLH